MNSIVYVVQEPNGKEITPAKEFGEVRVILSGGETVQKCEEILRNVLSKIKSHDYLIQIGSPFNVGLATHFALMFNEGHLNVLVWQWDRHCYVVREIHIV